KNLSDEKMIKDVSIYARKGEIVGIAGLVGAGKTELCKALFGAIPLKTGEIYLNGKKLSIQQPYMAVSQGLALVPEARRKEGVLIDEPVHTNLTLPSIKRFVKRGFIDFIKEY